ncbi:hypothetical protein [Mucilaginibacter ginsenosidivorans]|uniref:Uncharacterized protein n=1 Tax=Mucilaginibacter ginsenosidivorans TaxID=398053 RepID=A0A5B8UYQ9_9SPHI|nr:hypothetical protein [Mucilaginibacter ginsenosidivorans]QEC64132.1 hypothetical protein FRZ54_16625 [Mucilaginibacter ginsenosidivorans]
MFSFYSKHRLFIARAAVIIILMVIIRTLADALYHFKTSSGLTNAQLDMYFIGALVAASSALLIFLLYLWQKYSLVSLIALITIIVLIGIKVHYIGWNI